MTHTKTYLFSFLYALAGVISTCLFRHGDDNIIPHGLYCGLIFIAVTVICALFVSKLNFVKTIKFIVLTYLSYLIIFYITLSSSYFAFILGIVTGGLGSLLTFNFFNRFIKPISYSTKLVFGLGALAFTLNDLIVFTPLREIAPGFFGKDLIGNFSFIFFLWQFSVGLYLSKLLPASSHDLVSRVLTKQV